MRMRKQVLASFLCTTLLVLAGSPPLSAANRQHGFYIPKELYLIRHHDNIIVANIPFNRFDPLKLSRDESVRQTAESNAVVIVITNQKVLGYGSRTPTWRPVDLEKGEDIQKMDAQDYGALVVTNKRFLSFNGNNGAWAESRR